MTLPHEQIALALVQNLDVVRRMYERGWFEHSAIVNTAGVLRMPPSDPTLFAERESPPAGWKWCDLDHAASELNAQAIKLIPHLHTLKTFAEKKLSGDGMYKLWPSLDGYQTLLKAVYRAQSIHYELEDAFLRVPFQLDESFRRRSEQLVHGVNLDLDYPKVGENIRKMFKNETGIKWDRDLYSCLIDEFLLLGLGGINAHYRRHSSDAYLAGLAQLRPLELYIRDELKQLKQRPSLGLLGLAAYLRGRLQFGLSRYVQARDAWTESSECYSRKIEQKQTEFRTADPQKSEKWEDIRSLCLRRSALAAAMGNGYLLLVMSRLSACLEVVVLSRGILTKSCGAVYAAYVDLIYAAAKRAKHSFDPNVLDECQRLLEHSHETFTKLVEGSHYVQRANVELALVFHYQAKSLNRLREGALTRKEAVEKINVLYEKAITNLNSAIDYAAGKKQRTKSNPRMLAEAYAILSHICRHRPQSDYEQANRPGWVEALKNAHEALKHVGEMSQLECEARMALGIAYIAIAEGLKSGAIKINYRELAAHEGVTIEGRGIRPKKKSGRRSARQIDRDEEIREEEIWVNKQNADRELSRVLEINDTANPRISAICFLRLAQSALLRDTTIPDAWFYFRQYEAIADRVEHAFCHELAMKIEKELERRGQFFIVDLKREDLNVNDWKEKLEDQLLNETINRIVQDWRSLPTRNRPTGSPRKGRKSTELSLLTKDIEKYTRLSEATARTIAKKRLEEFRNKLKAVGAYGDG